MILAPADVEGNLPLTLALMTPIKFKQGKKFRVRCLVGLDDVKWENVENPDEEHERQQENGERSGGLGLVGAAGEDGNGRACSRSQRNSSSSSSQSFLSGMIAGQPEDPGTH